MPLWPMPYRLADAQHRIGITQTAVLDSGDVLYYVPLISEKSGPPADQIKAACVRHNPEFGTLRCESCRSRSCRHVGRLQLHLSRGVAA